MSCRIRSTIGFSAVGSGGGGWAVMPSGGPDWRGSISDSSVPFRSRMTLSLAHRMQLRAAGHRLADGDHLGVRGVLAQDGEAVLRACRRAITPVSTSGMLVGGAFAASPGWASPVPQRSPTRWVLAISGHVHVALGGAGGGGGASEPG